MSTHSSALHQLYEQQDIVRFRAFLALNGVGGAGSSSRKGKETATAPSGGAGSYGASGSLSRSPRFGGGYFDNMTSSNNGPSKEEVNARDKCGRSVIHLVASTVASFPEDLPPDTVTSLDYLEALLKSPVTNVNLQDKESGWTALHRAAYAGNLMAVRRLLQHPDISIILRDWEGLTAFDLLNSTLLGTNPMDRLDNVPEDEQEHARRELLTWGANRNFVLGLQGDSERTFAERVPLERNMSTYKKPGQEKSQVTDSYESISVQKIAMAKLHSGLLTDEPRGNFRLCGFGSSTGRLGHTHNHPQFAFETLKGFESQKVADFALGQDHTILCTQEGNVYTFGLNAFSVLGYTVETTTPSKPTTDEDLVQATPKRLFGAFKKEFIKGVAASRYHSVAFTEDTLFTWGKNNGQLGYSSSATPIQPSPRKVAAVDKPIKMVAATEVATVCLLESGEVLVLHRDTHFKINFPMTRLPAAMQPYRPPKLSWRPLVTKIDGSGTNFIAITNMGDLFSWQLDNPSLETPTQVPSNYGRDIKPYRVWEERKVFTACVDAAIANDTIVVCTRSGHVFVSARRKELSSIKGIDLRSGMASSGMMTGPARRNHKFSKVMNVQRVTQVAVSSSGGFGAIRRDAPLMIIPATGLSLSQSLLQLLPHYKRLEEALTMGRAPVLEKLPNQDEEQEEDEDESIETDIAVCTKICQIVELWEPTWSLPSRGTDLLLVSKGSSMKVPVHSTVLIARSPVLKRILVSKDCVADFQYTQHGTNTVSIPPCSSVSLLLLLHYIYTDTVPALYDGRVFRNITAQFPQLRLQAQTIKLELTQLALALELTELAGALQAFGKASPIPSLAGAALVLYQSSWRHDVILQTSNRDIPCHSAILRATCPFFEAIFNDPDWYAGRMSVDSDDEAPQPLAIDVKHLNSEMIDIAVEDLYTESALSRLHNRVYCSMEDRLDFAISLLSVANELMLDRLRAVCSSIIRPFINLNTVCALLCEAIYYEARNLQDCCMQYMACNMETMLEQRLLDLLPTHAMDRLAAFCRRRQLDRLPKTARSATSYEVLRAKYADYLKTLDIPKPTGGYRRYTRNASYSIRSPKLSPAQFTSSLKLSPNFSSSQNATLSPPPGVPPSPALSAVSATSPLVRPTHADDADTFDIEDLSLDSSLPSMSQVIDPLPSISGARARAAVSYAQGAQWSRPPAPVTPHTSLKDIMAAEGSPRLPRSTYTPPARRVSETLPAARSNLTDQPLWSPPSKLSQKERKQRQQITTSAPSSAEKPAPGSSSPWRPILPGAWKPPEADKEKPSLLSIQAQQGPLPDMASATRPASGRGTPDRSLPLNRRIPSAQGSAKQPDGNPIPGRDVTASSAPVITPVRASTKKKDLNTNRVPETRSHDTPWVNYLSTVSVQPTEPEIAAAQSFATIQNLQVTERNAIEKARGPMSLKEIQEEEDAVRREAEFISWFEEESRKAQEAAGIPVKPVRRGGAGAERGKTGRGGSSNRGRGGGGGKSRASTKAKLVSDGGT